MAEERKKRGIPSSLAKLLAVDVYISNKLVQNAENILPLKQLRMHYKALEISAHTLLWLPGWLAFIWILNIKSLYQMQVNLFIGLLVDLTCIAVIKALVRRARPTKNTDPFGIGPDKYSFPSGHASRCAFITYFFINIWPLSIFLLPSLLAWSTSVCLSRLLLRRHYALDIIGGVVLGILIGMFIQLIYLEADTCAYIINWITDEKTEGGEFHV